ncbi:YIP1 family protein [Metaplanococcus flavidus]|uniref:YIP1 family protein n=1 Tax=Metaplanococcus flavidus TaxID=569883 RepID=A0ABW3LEB7_9BACL
MEINPFLSVWTQPKETVRQFIKHNKLGYSMVLVSLAGIGGVITGLQDSGWFLDLSLAFWIFGILIVGIVSGFLNLGLNSLLYTLIGKLYGGHGKLRDMAIAVGPAMVPQIFVLPVLIIYILIYGERFFAAPADFSFTSIPLGASLLLTLLIAVASIWSIVITSKAIGVVHEFSSMRGFGVIMTIVGIFFIIALLVIIGIFIFLF